MGIAVNEQQKLFTLTTDSAAYQMKVNAWGILLHQYYGGKTDEEDMGYLAQMWDVSFAGNPYETGRDRTFSLDVQPQEYTSNGVGDYRINSIEVENADGTRGTDLRYVSYRIIPGKYALQGLPAMYGEKEDADTLEIVLKDTATDLEVTLYYSVWEEFDIITRAVKIKNGNQEPVRLEKAASVCLDLPYGDWDMMHFHGRHAMERQMERVPLFHGIQSVGSTRGASSHHHNPFVILCDKEATEDYGNCYGISLVYSGNFEAQIELDQLNQVRAVMGINSQKFAYTLQPGDEFITPEVVMVYSGEGLGAMSRKLHKAYQNHLCRGKYKKQRRPVLLNNWEATYFDFNEEKLLEIAKGAASLGVEMLVMDDGWFGIRNDDNTGLGDWYVNTQKLKGGLEPLVKQVNDLGLKFGIWLEPEMVSEDSDLYREHPDWAFTMPDRKPNRSRFQLVLDMTREDVRDYLFEKISKVLDSANIEYVKWDMNRSICDLYSADLPKDRQAEIPHRYILGLYDLLEKLTGKYPDVLFEGCSGGGGRFDPGMLYYSPQYWCSDDTDAIERIKIQYGTSFAYPISSVGSHVSAVPNHQTGRLTPFETRGVVAMAGSFGYELDLNKLSDEEKGMVTEQIERFKKYYDVIHYGDYYRLSNPFERDDYAAWEYVSGDKSEALLHGVVLHAKANMVRIHVKLKGLDPDKIYRVNGTDEIHSGKALMHGGILFPRTSGDYQAVEILLTEVS